MKTVLITGANRGIGLQHASVYASRGVKVYATARAPDEADDLQALAEMHTEYVEILHYDANAPSAAAAQLKKEIGDAPLDLLLSNAGGYGGTHQSFGDVSEDEMVQALRVNTIAGLKLAEAFVDNVAASERKVMAFQSTLMGSIADNSSGGYYTYRVTKAALNMIAKGISNDLRPRGVISVALHPGWVQTRMGGPNAPVSVEKSVAGQQRLLEELTLAQSGRFFNYDGQELPW